jgi:hypothetical protein
MDVERDLKDLGARNFVLGDEETDELLVRSFVRHDVSLESDNTVVAVSRAYESIHSKLLRKVVLEELRKDLTHDLWNRLARSVPDGNNKVLRDRVARTFLVEWESFGKPVAA